MEREFSIESWDEMCDIWCGSPEEDEDMDDYEDVKGPLLISLNVSCGNDVSDDECTMCLIHGRISKCVKDCKDYRGPEKRV